MQTRVYHSCFFNDDLILDICVIFQVLQKAKQRGQEELLAKRERLMVRLEKLGRRIEDFPLCSELDMMQQVQSQ